MKNFPLKNRSATRSAPLHVLFWGNRYSSAPLHYFFWTNRYPLRSATQFFGRILNPGLSDNVWSQESESLKQKVYAGSAIANGNSIFIIGGVDDNNEGYSQRIDLDENDEIVGVEQIAVLDGSSTMPVLFGLSQNICVSL